MTTFAMKGRGGNIYHGSHSLTPLGFTGAWHMKGPQPVGGGGVPEWVDRLMESNPNIQQIAISSADNGVVWSRITHSNPAVSGVDE